MTDGWIVIPNWERFQHYTDRRPVWIKVYTELNSSDDWVDLSLHQRGLLVTIWIEYARSDGRLKVSQMLRQIGTQKGLRFTLRTALGSLQEAGFIELSASRPLALARSREEEKRREEKTPPLPPSDIPLEDLPPFVSRADELRAVIEKAKADR